MASPPRLSLTQFNRFLDWFIPADLASDQEMRQGARMFLISHFFGPFLGNIIPAYLFVVNPNPGPDLAILAASISAFWAFPLLLRLTGQYTLLTLLSIQNLTAAILYGCYYYGGVSSPFLPWLLTVPLLAFFYLGPAWRPRLFVLILIAANLAGFYAFFLAGHSFPENLPLSSLQGIGIVSTLSASVYVTMMALYYAKALASQAELENEVKRHLATAAELRRATAEAERAGAAKSDFLAKMSHELRTPLNAVIGYSQILLEDAAYEGDTQNAADLERIHEAGQHLLRLVNEVLDLSKIEAGKMELFNETLEAADLIRTTVESCRGLVEKGGNVLLLALDEELGTIVCDARKLQQAMTQILDNAAKFTEKGTITVLAKRRSSQAGDEIVIAVRDTGIGISQESLPGLFEKFSVADDSTSSKYGGTGLGLALSQKLCRLMGGDVAVESELGVGSCFTLWVPVAPTALAATPHEMETPAVGLAAASPHAEGSGTAKPVPTAA